MWMSAASQLTIAMQIQIKFASILMARTNAIAELGMLEMGVLVLVSFTEDYNKYLIAPLFLILQTGRSDLNLTNCVPKSSSVYLSPKDTHCLSYNTQMIHFT